ncbi:hypothetical protein ACTXT7_001082 [Hymenolepis weldensis]
MAPRSLKIITLEIQPSDQQNLPSESYWKSLKDSRGTTLKQVKSGAFQMRLRQKKDSSKHRSNRIEGLQSSCSHYELTGGRTQNSEHGKQPKSRSQERPRSEENQPPIAWGYQRGADRTCRAIIIPSFSKSSPQTNWEGEGTEFLLLELPLAFLMNFQNNLISATFETC